MGIDGWCNILQFAVAKGCIVDNCAGVVVGREGGRGDNNLCKTGFGGNDECSEQEKAEGFHRVRVGLDKGTKKEALAGKHFCVKKRGCLSSLRHPPGLALHLLAEPVVVKLSWQ